MTKIDTLECLNGNLILESMLEPQEQVLMKQIVDRFYSYRYKVPSSVFNAVLIYAIIKSKEKMQLPNIVYLRKTMETFIAARIVTSAAAVNYFENMKDFRNKNKPSAEPEWMDDYVKRVALAEN